jgi:hypothetical protein
MFWVSVDPATGRVYASTGTPLPADPYIAGIRYQAAKPCAMYCQSGAAPPGALIQYGVAHDAGGVVYVLMDAAPPVPAYYSDGVLVDKFGTLYGTTVNPVAYHNGGVPVDSAGRVCFGAGGFGPVAQFNAPLLTTLVPTAAGDPSFTFTRGSPAYVQDQDQVLRQASANEARFQGARRVQNRVANSQNFTDVTWVKQNMTAVYGVMGPTGQLDANTLTAATAGAAIYNASPLGGPFTDRYGVTSVWMRRRTGTGVVQLRDANNNSVDITSQLDGTWKRFGTATALLSQYLAIAIVVLGDAVDVAYAQLEEVSGAANQAPSEYVSVGVLAAPFHGAGVDGTKYFGTTNGNSGGNTNLQRQSQTLDDIVWGKSNGTIAANTQTAPDGTLTADTFTSTLGSYCYINSGVAVGAAGPVTVSIHVKAGTATYGWIDDTGQNVRAVFNATTGAFTAWELPPTTHKFSSQVLPNGWIRVSLSWVAPGPVTSQIGLSMTPVSGADPANLGKTIHLWGAQIEQGPLNAYIPTTAVAVTNNVVTEAAGAAIPPATLLGYVAENAATNLCLQSQTFDAAAWSKVNVTITPNAQTAPDGSLTADTVTDNATSGSHWLYGNISFTAAPYTASFYVKGGTLSWCQVYLWDGTNTHWSNINLATGALGFVSGIPAVVTALPNGWFRVSVSWTAAATGGNFGICGSNANNNSPPSVYVGTGQTMYLWGAQVEQGSEASSYIPTTTAAATRNSDVLYYPWVGNLDGVVATTYAETYMLSSAGLIRAIFQHQSDFLPQYIDNLNHYQTFTLAGGAAAPNLRIDGAINKSASAWSGATNSMCLNGGAVGTSAYAAFANAGQICIGSRGGGSALCGSIRNVKLYATRLTDAQLQAMTA